MKTLSFVERHSDAFGYILVATEVALMVGLLVLF